MSKITMEKNPMENVLYLQEHFNKNKDIFEGIIRFSQDYLYECARQKHFMEANPNIELYYLDNQEGIDKSIKLNLERCANLQFTVNIMHSHSDMVEKYNNAAIVEQHGEVNNQKHLLDCASNLLIQERTMNTMLRELHDLDNILSELHNLYLTDM